MKVLYIACNVVARSEIEKIIETLGITRYDLIPQVLFYASKTSPRLDTAIWPGYNVSFLVFEKDGEKTQQLLQSLTEYNQRCPFEEEKVEVYEFNVTEVTGQ